VNVTALNPLQDDRWNELVLAHPAASVFHTSSWLEALRRTYGYEPILYTTSSPGAAIVDGVLFCRITSWMTGRRMVSVPFADHCEPLVDSPGGCALLADAIRRAVGEGWRSAELRLRGVGCWGSESGFAPAAAFRLHELDLTPPIDEVYRRFHKGTIQRKIRRAEREGLHYERGRSDALLETFYRLMLLTRRRHGIPPQPRQWFRNLVDCFADRLTIHVASRPGRAVGGILTLGHGSTVVYKYGCSNAAFHPLGVMPFLFWKAIQEAKAGGATKFDLGRSELDNPGLIAFKERLGGVPSTLTYYRVGRNAAPRCPRRIPASIMERLPDSVLALVGRVLYPHIG
jgi:hypothetical protein